MPKKPNLSVRAQLRDLVTEHPDWTYKQYAEVVGVSTDSVRGSLNAMGLSKKQRRVSSEKQIRKVSFKPPKRTLAQESVSAVSSSTTRSRSVGYLKLI